MIMTTQMSSINLEEIMKFIEADLRWPLVVDPGRRTGKTEAALQIASRCANNKCLPALYVAPNRTECRRLEQRCKSDSPENKKVIFITYSNLEKNLRGRLFSIIIFDEPGIPIRYGAASLVARIIREKGCPAVIFGDV